ncbi:MAG: hypothetical protein ACQEQG_05940 [Bacillota bacterium]
MKLFNFIKSIFKSDPNSKDDLIKFKIKDDKCGEITEIKVMKNYDISRVYDDTVEADYRLKKVVICQHCYNKINLEVLFNRNYQVISTHCENGEIL